MANFLKREKTKLRVKQSDLPMSSSPILGMGIDVATLPEGHAACPVCSGFRFEPWMYLDNRRVEMGCLKCGASYRFLFPLGILLPEAQGRFTCKKHPTAGFIAIHNTDILCIGCEKCATEIRIPTKIEDKSVRVVDA